MAMVGVDSGSLYRRTHSLSRLAWSWVGGRLAPFYIHQRRPLGAVLHSSNEPGELSQWLCHDDSSIDIVLDIIIIIIIINIQTLNTVINRTFYINLTQTSKCPK